MDYLFIIAFVIFQACFLIQLYFILVVQRRLRNYHPSEPDPAVCHPVSVIICARNEQRNLTENLQLVLDQDYPDFEVIVVNDCSNDDSKYVLEDFALRYPRLKIVSIAEHERFRHGKKFAVTLGIKASKNEHLVFTDADCRPASVHWLKQIQANFTGDTEIVLGYSPYMKLAGFVNKLICFETFNTALNYFSFSLAGKPYMGVGRNLAYTKTLFFKGKGFASHMHILSGDDDLFVNQHATERNTVIEVSSDSHVWSDPKRTFSDYIKQKLRHAGAGKAYKKPHRQMLTLQAVSGIVFYILIFALLASGAQPALILSVYFLRLIIQLIVYYPIFKRLNYNELIYWFPILDFIYYFYLLALNIITLFKKEVQWR